MWEFRDAATLEARLCAPVQDDLKNKVIGDFGKSSFVQPV
jgi:hypothetical protein